MNGNIRFGGRLMNREALERLQWSKLSSGLDHVFAVNPFYRQRFAAAGIERGSIKSLADFNRLPFTTKAELLDDQQANPPYGTNLSQPLTSYIRCHQTTGTSGRRLRWLDTPQNWSWLTEELWPAIFHAAGLRESDRLFFPFSFGPFLGFWAAFDGAQKMGRFVLAGGGFSTSARLHLLLEHQISVLLCTPTYGLRLAEAAAEEGIDLPSSKVRMLIVAGEPGGSIPAVRSKLEAGWGARVYDHSGMTEIGSLGVEFEELPGKPFLLEDHCIAEVIDPQTGAPVADGELGELVLTNLGRWDSPLLRYRTGDLVRARFGMAPASAPFPYVHLEGGVLGRVDDMLWIKGNNVYPSAVESVLREFDAVVEFQLVATQPVGELVIRIETAGEVPADFARRIETAVYNRLHFRPTVERVPPGELPRFEMKASRLVKKTLTE
jgi:phenylacetate-CoA ligase